MGEKTIYLIRHGKTGAAGETKRFIGQIDIPLGEEGRGQMRRLGEQLRDRSLDALFCSDLDRCRESAELIALACGTSVRTRPELREISLGAWEGLSFEETKRRYPEEFAARGADIVSFAPPGGESFRRCARRVIPVFQSIAEHTGETIAIVGHAGVNRIILCSILGMPLKNLFLISQDFGCANETRLGDSGFRVVRINARSI